MKNFTTSNKIDAEIALRKLNKKASDFYRDADPLKVYLVDGKFYIRGIIEENELTFEEIEELFAAYSDELND